MIISKLIGIAIAVVIALSGINLNTQDTFNEEELRDAFLSSYTLNAQPGVIYRLSDFSYEIEDSKAYIEATIESNVSSRYIEAIAIKSDGVYSFEYDGETREIRFL